MQSLQDLGEACNITSLWSCFAGPQSKELTSLHNNSLEAFSVHVGLLAASCAALYLCLAQARKQGEEALARCGCFANGAGPPDLVEDLDEGPETTTVKPEHLVVLVSGIAGSPANWKFMEAQFKERSNPKMMVLLSDSNSFTKTLDGVDVMGKRLATEVVEAVSKYRSLRKISFVAHSLGGLVARYAIGQLYVPASGAPHQNGTPSPAQAEDDSGNANGGAPGAHGRWTDAHSIGGDARELVDMSHHSNGQSLQQTDELVLAQAGTGEGRPLGLRDATVAGLEPVNFVTIATPHLGCLGKGHLPFLFKMGFLEKATPHLAPHIVGTTGRHLFLADDPPPLLLRMVSDNEEGAFLSALKAFKKRSAYANTGWDQMVGWRTASIRRATEMPVVPKKEADPKYRYIMRVEDLPAVEEKEREQKQGRAEDRATDHNKGQQTEHLEPLSSVEDAIVTALQQMPWKRVDVSFQAARMPWMAHNLIQVKSKWMHSDGASVIYHVIDHMQP